MTYMLRNIDPDLWTQVKARAAQEGRPLRFVILALLKLYADKGYTVVEEARAKDDAADTLARWMRQNTTKA